MDIRLMRSHSAVREDQGRLALMRGPLVYCLEEIDNGANLHNICLDPSREITAEVSDELSEGMVILKTTGRRYTEDAPNQSLYYTFTQPAYTETALRFVPYYAWNNRGEGEMQVWTRYTL